MSFENYWCRTKEMASIVLNKHKRKPNKGKFKFNIKNCLSFDNKSDYAEGYLRLYGRTNRVAALTKMSELQHSIDGWEGKDIGQFCNEFVMDGPLCKLSDMTSRSPRISERYVFLFDGLMVLCKPNNKRSSMTTVTGNTQYDWRLKEKYLIKNIEIIDREEHYNYSEINGLYNNSGGGGSGGVNGTHNIPKYVFEIAPRNQQKIILFAKTAEEKALWMSNLILLNTRSMLERTLDSMLIDEAKKHPLRLPSPDVYRFSVEDSDSNIIFEENKSNSGVPLIKGATLLKLVERLTYHTYADPMFVRTFLTTYRSFCTPQALLSLLIERFEIPEPEFNPIQINNTTQQENNTITTIPVNSCETINNIKNNNNDTQFNNANSTLCLNNDSSHSHHIYENSEIRNQHREVLKRFRKEYSQPVQFRVLNVLRHWIDNHYYDFERDPNLLEILKKFLDEKVKSKKNMRKWCENIMKVLDRKTEITDEHHITHSFEMIPPNIEWWLTRDTQKFDLLTLHPIELARQLTLLEFDLYRAVKPSELVGTEGQSVVWTKKDKQKTSPNLLKMIHHTSNFTFWLEKCIVEAVNFEERVAILSRIIEIMIVLQELNNFNGVFEVISAMGSACVHRLDHTMSYIEKNSKLKRALDDAQELTVEHFKKYHEKLRSINPPCVPFFGMYLTNILHIEEGNPEFLATPQLINFSKRRKVAEITGEIQQYQNQPYCLTIVPEIRQFLESLNPFKGQDEKELIDYLYNKSLEIEPRHTRQLNKFPRQWPEISLKSPGIKPRGNRNHHLPALQSLDSLLNSLTSSQNEESITDESQTHSPTPPQTPPYSANSCGTGSDNSVFAPVFIGHGSTYGGSSLSTSIQSTPPRSGSWSSISSLPPNPSTPPPLPPRINRSQRTNSMSYSSDLSSPYSRFEPIIEPIGNTFDDLVPPPLPPRSSTFSTTLSRNCYSGATATILTANQNIEGFNSEIIRRNSVMDLPPTEPLSLSRRFSQSGHSGPTRPLPISISPNSDSVFSVPIGPCPQLPPKTYRQTLANIY
ncbi:son of sevenless homolog 2-like [Oppia nitens]|uniref:son of sevenless homolog 2-like n=1 Tax=Oppia nitens TaxID=1686743 RepID=UPI0023DAB6E6|nr:son of sevenless homolog 2-like [Oppia nitens]